MFANKMVRNDERRRVKLAILARIKEKRQVVFAPFSGRVRKEDKRRAWAGVTRFARSLGLCGRIERDPTYMRDIWWQNVRKQTMEKIETAKEPGCSEQVAKRWNEYDDFVLSILGRQPPKFDVSLLSGGSSSASVGAAPDAQPADAADDAVFRDDEFEYEVLDDEDFDFDIEGDGKKERLSADPLVETLMEADTDRSLARERASTTQREPKPGALGIRNLTDIHSARVKRERWSCEETARSKVELEMELLRVQTYLARLQARQLELALGLPAGAATAELGAGDARGSD